MVLILIIAVLSILSTLIPQQRDAAFYFHNYGSFGAGMILWLGFDEFFRSIPFVLPVGLFFINLTVCTVDRLVNRRRREARRRHGPDLIHLGLLLLIIGAMFSAFGRREGLVYMGKDDEIRLPGRYVLRLVSCEYVEYEDGRPKDWISTVQVLHDGREAISAYAIEVNKPLRIGGIRVYQNSFAREDRAVLEDEQGQASTISNGQGFEAEGAMLVFRRIDGESAVFERWEQHTRTAVSRLELGDTIGKYRLTELESRDVTGLKAVKDPGFIPVVAALIIVAAGLGLTLIQKRKDKQL